MPPKNFSPGLSFFLWSLFVSTILIYQGLNNISRQKQINQVFKTAETQTLGISTKISNCQIRGPLPDPDCTPGSVFTDKTLEQICVSGYTQTVRNVPLSLRKQVYAAYGVSYPPPRGSYELDHHIPLAIGGDNSFSNLWPEIGEPKPGFKEKDVVEIYLREEVCAGRIDISVAQQKIAQNWLEIYELMDKTTIDRLRSKYQNWSN